MTDTGDDGSTPESGRSRAAHLRDQAGRRRDVTALRRDQDANQRDEAAQVRDQVAADRERSPDATDAENPGDPSAAHDRVHAGQDRAAGAGDRRHAADDRDDAASDRRAAAQDRQHASFDGLTGVYTRQAGLIELDRDVARVTRTGHLLVLAFVDVDHLKGINDSHGHAAGDRLLRRVADTLTAALRPSDLVIRHGGDEFLCAIEGIDSAAARLRLARVNTMLAADREPGSVTIGIAELQEHENCEDLIARADTDLYRQRQHRTDP